MAQKKEEKLTLEEMFEKLESTLSELEGEDNSLERSFTLYEQGIKLVKDCESEIDTVEKKVLELSAGGKTSEFS